MLKFRGVRAREGTLRLYKTLFNPILLLPILVRMKPDLGYDHSCCIDTRQVYNLYGHRILCLFLGIGCIWCECNVYFCLLVCVV